MQLTAGPRRGCKPSAFHLDENLMKLQKKGVEVTEVYRYR